MPERGTGELTRADARVEGLLSGRSRALTIGVVTVVTLIAFEGMAVTTVMPVAVRDLRGMPLYAWGFSAFLIANLVGTVLSGQWSDRRGPTRPYFAGVAIFTAGLLLAGTAPTMWVFVPARAVQGFGAGLVFVTIYVVIGRTYEESVRPRAFAALSGAWVVPAVVGPTVAGLVAEHLSWRWAFLGLPPLVLPAVLMMLPTLRRPDLAGGAASGTGRGRVLPAIALAAGAAALLEAGQGLAWWHLAPLAIGLAALAYGLHRLLPRGALRFASGLPSTVVIRGLLTGAFFGTDAFIPLGLITLRGFSPSHAGLALTGGALGWTLGSWYQSRPRLGVPRHRLVQAGAALIGLAILVIMLALLSGDVQVDGFKGVMGWLAVPGWALGGLGMGLSMASLSVLVLEQSPLEEQGANSSALQACDILGSALSIGIGGVILAAAAPSLSRGLGLSEALTLAIALAAVLLAPRIRSTIET
jgi:MFS family permease